MRSFNDVVVVIAFSITELIVRMRPVDDEGRLLAMDWHFLDG